MNIKKWVFIIAFILLMIAMVPWTDGYLVKHSYYALIKNLNAKNPNYHIEVLGYDRGWLDSTVQIAIEPSNKTAKAKNPSFEGILIDQIITHGPYVPDPVTGDWIMALAEINTEVSLPATLVSSFTKDSDKGDLYATTLVGFLGDLKSDISMPAYAASHIPGLVKLSWSGMTGHLETKIMHHQVKNIQGTLALGALSVQTNSGSIVLSPFSAQFNLTSQSVGLWQGTKNTSIPYVTISDLQGPRLIVKNINLDTVFSVGQDNLYNLQTKIAMNSLTTADFAVGPALLKLSATHVNYPLMIKSFYAAYASIDKLNEFVPLLIMPDTLVTETVELTTSAGKLSSTGQFYWPKSTPLPKLLDDVVKQAGYKVDLRASISLVNKALELLYPHVPVPVSSESSDAGLISKIENWGHEKKIPLDVSYQLKDIVLRKLPTPVFIATIDRYVLTKQLISPIAEEIKSAYTLVHPIPTKLAPIIPVVAAQPVLTDYEIMKNKLNDWIKQGLITQNNDDYVTTLIHQ